MHSIPHSPCHLVGSLISLCCNLTTFPDYVHPLPFTFSFWLWAIWARDHLFALCLEQRSPGVEPAHQYPKGEIMPEEACSCRRNPDPLWEWSLYTVLLSFLTTVVFKRLGLWPIFTLISVLVRLLSFKLLDTCLRKYSTSFANQTRFNIFVGRRQLCVRNEGACNRNINLILSLVYLSAFFLQLGLSWRHWSQGKMYLEPGE